MKRLILMLALVGLILTGCATYSERWHGPAGKATPVCTPQPGLGFTMGDKEFVRIGTYKGEDVYVLRQRGGVK